MLSVPQVEDVPRPTHYLLSPLVPTRHFSTSTSGGAGDRRGHDIVLVEICLGGPSQLFTDLRGPPWSSSALKMRALFFLENFVLCFKSSVSCLVIVPDAFSIKF